MEPSSTNLVFFSSCLEIWGGSEELWAQAAEILAKKGYQVHVFKLSVDFTNPQIKRLEELGCHITDLNDYVPSFVRRLWNRFLPYNIYRTLAVYIRKHLAREVKRIKPELFVISQGANFDGFEYVGYCPLDKLKYVVISQRADNNHWINDNERGWTKKIWQGSAKNYFVSQHNRKLTEEQFGHKMENADVVRNPFLTKIEEPLPWTFTSDKIRLACVGRLFLLDKGQDILLRVLADKKWRERNVEVSFFGKGRNKVGLLELAKYLGLQNVFFNGHISDIVSIWQSHHALILPSRNEGLPLALVEAMLCGRTAIVTDVGGNKEVLEDNVTGFIAKSVDETGVDEALERAWRRVDEWEQIGKLAAQEIRKLIPSNPAEVFADKLITVINETNKTADKDSFKRENVNRIVS